MNPLTQILDFRFVTLASVLMLAACGGGGDSSSSDTTTTSTTTDTTQTSTETVATDTTTVTSEATCNIANFAQAMLDAVNQARIAGRTCGTDYYPAVAPLTWNSQLAQAAAGHSTDMANNNYFSHTSLDGRSFLDRINATGYLGSYWGENIYAGGADVSTAVNAWLDSPGHCANIMNANFKDLGAACAYNASSSYGYYWTQDFAAPR